MTRTPSIRRLCAAVLAMAALGLCFTPAEGGVPVSFPAEASFDKAPVLAPDEDALEWEFGIDGWMPWIKGTVIVPVEIGLDLLIKNLDFYVPVTMGVQKGRWGLDANILWMKLSGHDNDLDSELLTSFRLGMKLFIAEAIAHYRVAEWDEGASFLEVGAGARGVWLDVNLGFSENDPGIAATSERLATQTIDRIGQGIRNAVGKAAAGLKSELEGRLPARTIDGIGRGGRDAARMAASELKAELEGLEGEIPGEGGRGFSRRVLSNGRVGDAIKRVAEARVEEGIAAAEAALSAEKAKLASEAKQVREKAEEKLADEIDRAVRKAIPGSAGGSKGWIDPIVMMRIRQQLTDKLFLQVYGDIGGFGVSSRLTWLAQAGFGYQVQENFAAGIYFRYWMVDYESGSFIFDIDAYGPVVSATWTF